MGESQPLAEGDCVKITEGPYMDKEGEILHIDQDKTYPDHILVDVDEEEPVWFKPTQLMKFDCWADTESPDEESGPTDLGNIPF